MYLERFDPPDRDEVIFRANGCIEVRLNPFELVSVRTFDIAEGWRSLLRRRLPPLVWFAMPGHDDPKNPEDAQPGEWSGA